MHQSTESTVHKISSSYLWNITKTDDKVPLCLQVLTLSVSDNLADIHGNLPGLGCGFVNIRGQYAVADPVKFGNHARNRVSGFRFRLLAHRVNHRIRGNQVFFTLRLHHQAFGSDFQRFGGRLHGDVRHFAHLHHQRHALHQRIACGHVHDAAHTVGGAALRRGYQG